MASTMQLYQHYSFDLWLTLIRSHPQFKKERALMFQRKFNPNQRSLGEILDIFRSIDLMCNAINETTGKNIDADEMYLMVISQMNGQDTDLKQVDTAALYAAVDELIFDMLPLVYCSSTLDVLKRIKDKGHTISLLSNTGFIKGQTLRKVLQLLGLDIYLDFQLYSDEAGLSKPGKAFYELMIGQVQERRAAIALPQIIHVGDNPHADIQGAQTAGISCRLINSNQQCILSLLN